MEIDILNLEIFTEYELIRFPYCENEFKCSINVTSVKALSQHRDAKIEPVEIIHLLAQEDIDLIAERIRLREFGD